MYAAADVCDITSIHVEVYVYFTQDVCFLSFPFGGPIVLA